MCVSVGLNPPGITYYMDESAAARAARDAGTKALILQHFDLWESTRLDPGRVATVARWYCPDVDVVPARFQRRIDIASANPCRGDVDSIPAACASLSSPPNMPDALDPP
jgi:L-ascorbate metabolism protein UlaG (beta-lactamase superfamily)